MIGQFSLNKMNNSNIRSISESVCVIHVLEFMYWLSNKGMACGWVAVIEFLRGRF